MVKHKASSYGLSTAIMCVSIPAYFESLPPAAANCQPFQRGEKKSIVDIKYFLFSHLLKATSKANFTVYSDCERRSKILEVIVFGVLLKTGNKSIRRFRSFLLSQTYWDIIVRVSNASWQLSTTQCIEVKVSRTLFACFDWRNLVSKCSNDAIEMSQSDAFDCEV